MNGGLSSRQHWGMRGKEQRMRPEECVVLGQTYKLGFKNRRLNGLPFNEMVIRETDLAIEKMAKGGFKGGVGKYEGAGLELGG
jgi:hypothetical protein